MSGETLLVGKQRDDVVVYLYVVESRQTIRYSGQPGDFKPLHSSSIGKSPMAMMDRIALDAWLAKYPLRRLSKSTITSARKLYADLDAARAAGYHVSDGETTAGVLAIAVGIPLDGGPVGVSIAGPKFRIESRLERHVALLLKLQKEFSIPR